MIRLKYGSTNTYFVPGAGGGLLSSFMHGDPEILWDGTMELYYYSREKYEEAR